MNLKATTLLTLGLAGLVSCASGQGVTNIFSLRPNALIPDANPVGWQSLFNVSGLEGTVANVRVTLDISGGYNGDLYACLVAPQGLVSVLLNRPGVTASNPFGYYEAGLNITLDSAAANNIHNYGAGFGLNLDGQVLGTWTADGRVLDPQSDGLAYDRTPSTAGLDVFDTRDGVTLDGTWTIFIVDCAGGGGASTLNSVGLEVITVPEPGSGLLLLSVGLGFLWLRLTARRTGQP
jgi:subtilisin-like proprotein convertase family protein